MRHIIIILLSFEIMLFSYGCAGEPEQPLRIGMNDWPAYDLLFVGRDKGFYDKNMVQPTIYPSTTEVMKAFDKGEINAACLTLDEALLMASSRSDFKIVFVIDVSNGADALMARKGIAKLGNLKKKKIGAETTALGRYFLARTLDIGRLSQKDISIVSIPISEHEKAFTSGTVDAVVTFEPVKTRLLKSGALNIFDSRMLPNEIVDVLVVRDDYLAAHPSAFKKFARGWFLMIDSMENSHALYAPELANIMGVSETDVTLMLYGMEIPDKYRNKKFMAPPSPLLLDMMDALEVYMLQKGLLQKDSDTGKLFSDKVLWE